MVETSSCRLRQSPHRRRVKTPPSMALQRARRPRIRSGRALRSLGSPLNARSSGDRGSDRFIRRVRRSHGYRHSQPRREPFRLNAGAYSSNAL